MQIDSNDISVSLYATDKPRWMMDSGTIHHIMPYRSDFTDYTPIKGTVRLGDKSTVDQTGTGTVIFNNPQDNKISLSNVLYVPSVHMRFLSTGTIADKRATILFDHKGFEVNIDQKCVAKGYQEDKLYWLDTLIISLNAHIAGAAASLHIWHQRIGHMSHAAIEKHGPKALKGLDLKRSAVEVSSICAGCKMGKSM